VGAQHCPGAVEDEDPACALSGAYPVGDHDKRSVAFRECPLGPRLGRGSRRQVASSGITRMAGERQRGLAQKCADMLVRVELAEAAVREAARLADEGSP
jgi:hypothetical protein